ncbi:E3 ubiquitin-protein ligase TRIM33-like [Amphiura filiformis]|uniref:E3 ubiquitin-protein ligase TRIM33-like n=1 Tax=Amphiura filiformis TaxID=82378 RepID=UPI003B221B77
MMATSLSPEMRKEDFKDEFLTCSICAESYDNDKHKAKCLPCLHTYCKSCLQRIAGKRSKLDCPKCRKTITLPGRTVDSLPNNFIVANLKEYQDIFNLSVSCGGCESVEAAISFCHNCGRFLCHKCVDSHRQYGPLQNHKLLTLAELQEKKYNPMTQRQQHCSKHTNQELTMYCREADCKVPVCATCGLVDHRGHDLTELSAAIAKVIDGIQHSTARVRERNQDLSRKQLAAESLQETLTINFTNRKKEMQELAKKLHSQIDRTYNNAHFNMKNLYDTEMINVTASIKSMDSLATQMTNACEFANKSCDMSQSTQLLTSQNQIIERLHELETAELPESAPDKREFNFTEKHYSAKAQIQESLQELYDLEWIQHPQQRGQTKLIDINQKQSTTASNRPSSALPARKPQVDPQQCTIQFGLPSAKGWFKWNKAIVQTVDETGHKMSTGGAKVQATQDGYPCDVQDNNDGTYTFDYQVLAFRASLDVTINESGIKGSPFSWKIRDILSEPLQTVSQVFE